MKKEWIKDLIWFICVIAIVGLLRYFVFSNVTVSGTSMYPTLKDRDRVIALKNVKVKRFDIITFPAPDQKGASYVKRVIGLPGETVAYKDDNLYINGKKYKEPYLDASKKKLVDGNVFTDDFTFKDLKDVLHGATKVPKGEVFVLGDNRPISKDSRYIGFIKEKDISGTVRFRYWPFKEFGSVH